jgi:cardiolipin synthase
VEFPAWLDWPLAASLALAAIEIAGIALAIDAIMRNRTPQGTIAWVVSLVLLPIAAIPFYLVFGNRRFNGYVKALRRGQKSMRSLWEHAHAAVEPFAVRAASPDGPRDAVPSEERGVCATLGRLTALPATRGNKARLLVDGEQAFEAILAAIAEANRYVLVQFYIVRHDGIGRRFREALLAARRRGCEVRLLYDELGSADLDVDYFAPLREAGCEIAGFRGSAKGHRFQIQFRNHRKTVVVDGETAFVGGINVGDEYLGLDPAFGPWRDTHVEIRGPSVMAVQMAWCEDWHWATGTIPELSWSPKAVEQGIVGLVLPSGPADELETCMLMFLHLIGQAKRRLWIATPYFVPDPGIISALQLAAKRGVDVRVMIPEKGDNRLVWLSMFSYYPDVIPAGVKVYRYTKGFMHQKVVLADLVAAVGTANFDNRSFRINFEMTVLSEGEQVAEAMAEMLHKDFERCHGARLADFERRPWWFRAMSRAARLASPVQ